MTKLEAVNLILRALSEHTVSSTEIRHPSVTRALDAIDIARQELLDENWWFNNYPVTLVRDTDSKIPVAELISEFVPDSGVGFVLDGFLYSPEKLSFVWDADQKGTATFEVDYENLPGAAQRAVAYAAAIAVYSDDVGGNPPSHLINGYSVAVQQLQSAHIRQFRYNARSRPTWQRYRRALRG